MSHMLILTGRELLTLQRQNELMRIVVDALGVGSLVKPDEDMLALAHAKIDGLVAAVPGESTGGTISPCPSISPFGDKCDLVLGHGGACLHKNLVNGSCSWPVAEGRDLLARLGDGASQREARRSKPAFEVMGCAERGESC